MPLRSVVQPVYMKMDSVFHFGQYKGEAVQDVVYKDPQYIRWVADEVEDVDFDFYVLDTAYDYIHEGDPDYGFDPYDWDD